METSSKSIVHSVEATSLADVIDRVLDKGLVINADIAISLAGVELLGIRIRAVLASLETAAKYGLQLPAGANLDTDAPGWIMRRYRRSGIFSERFRSRRRR